MISLVVVEIKRAKAVIFTEAREDLVSFVVVSR